jgi:hypothetical protein
VDTILTRLCPISKVDGKPRTVLLQSMSVGKPVTISRTPTTEEYGEHGKTLYFVDYGSEDGRERLNAEIKRRTNVVGIFPNDASIVRLVGAMMLEQNDEWSLNRRYMQLEGLQTVSDTVPTRLSAVAR